MQMMDITVLSLLALLVIILLMLVSRNSKLAKENKKLNEILDVKNVTISNYEASRVAVKDVIENFSSLDEVMGLVNEGESVTRGQLDPLILRRAVFMVNPDQSNGQGHVAHIGDRHDSKVLLTRVILGKEQAAGSLAAVASENTPEPSLR